jgi:hypothetical protein
MSVYVLDRDHIRYLVSAATRPSIIGLPPLTWVWGIDQTAGTYQSSQLRPSDGKEAAQVAQVLREQNIRSVAYYYRRAHGEPLPGLRGGKEFWPFKWWSDLDDPAIEPAQVVKACQAYAYQCCEDPGWNTSEACAFIRALERSAVDRMLDQEEERTGKKLRWQITRRAK